MFLDTNIRSLRLPSITFSRLLLRIVTQEYEPLITMLEIKIIGNGGVELIKVEST